MQRYTSKISDEFDRGLGYTNVQRKLNILNIKKTYIRHRYCKRKRRRRGARQEEDLVREDSGCNLAVRKSMRKSYIHIIR